PSGKDESRKLLSLETIDANKGSIKRIFDRFLTFGEGKTDAVTPDNAEWLTNLNYIEFLRDVGRYFSVNRMLAMESVKLRLERDHELSFIEFNYMCLQAYDFTELFKRYGCHLQMGGSDQWGNIVTGIDLGRRMGCGQLYALTSPLLTTSSGAKMGKTAAGAVWLNEDMLSVYDYWQYWRNSEDKDVGRFLRLFTELPIDEIIRLEALDGVEINAAKNALATEATAMAHGRTAAQKAAETARKTFVEGVLSTDLRTVPISLADLQSGALGVLQANVLAGMASSTSEARRAIANGGLRVNDVLVADPKMILRPEDVTAEGVIKLSLGRKKHVLLKPR
ncbi:MAG TPA: tyrosine--tRNA ligase, partial [Beijerinckiaceae bacterium]|nr:tyrosine--tRNA ligase [Beijerinckiaceae bacterium]